MGLDMILRMVMRRILGKAVNAGVDAGVRALSGGKGRKGRGRPQLETPAEAETRADKERIRAIRRARRAKRGQ